MGIVHLPINSGIADKQKKEVFKEPLNYVLGLITLYTVEDIIEETVSEETYSCSERNTQRYGVMRYVSHNAALQHHTLLYGNYYVLMLLSTCNISKMWRCYNYYCNLFGNRSMTDDYSISNTYIEDVILSIYHHGDTIFNDVAYIFFPSPLGEGVFLWTTKHTDSKNSCKNHRTQHKIHKIYRISKVSLSDNNVFIFYSFYFFDNYCCAFVVD